MIRVNGGADRINVPLAPKLRRVVLHGLVIVSFATLCMSAVSHFVAYEVSDGDTRDAMQRARQCVELGQCPSMGTHASGLGLSHGASWIRLLSYSLRNGGGLKAVQTTVLALLIVSAGLFFLVMRRYLPEEAALAGLLLYLQPVAATGRFPALTNATLLPLPLVLYYASVAICVESGSTVAGALAAVCLAAAMSANLSSVLMVPFHIGLVALFARRPRRAVVVAGLSLAIAFTLESRDAARAIAGVIGSMPVVLGLLIVAAVFVGVPPLRRRFEALRLDMERLRGRLASLPVRLRLRAVMKAAILYVNVAVWAGCALVSLRIPQVQYLAPLVFPVVFLAADSIESLSRRAILALSAIGFVSFLGFPFAPLGDFLETILLQVVSGLAMLTTLAWAMRWRGPILGHNFFSPAPSALPWVCAGLALAASLPDSIVVPRDRQAWPVGASENLANGLYELGFTFPQLLGSLQPLSPGTVQDALAALDPNLFGQPAPVVDTGWSLLALMVAPVVARRTEGVVLTFPINDSRSAIVVRAPSYLDRSHLRRCHWRACGMTSPPEGCTDREPERPLHHWPFFEITPSGNPDPPPWGRFCVVFSIPLHTSGSGVRHIVGVEQLWPLHLRIARVSGVDFDGQLPGPEVQLLNTREAAGTLEVEVSGDVLGHWLAEPPLIEVTAANQHLLQPFREKRVSLW